MNMKDALKIPASEITPRELFHARRRFMQLAAGLSAAALLPGSLLAGEKLPGVKTSPFAVPDELTPLDDVTRYNNFYEFGTDKESPAKLAGSLKTRPWTVAVEGEVVKPKVFDIDELLQLAALEERIYRLRCVEAWSMVVPWVGFSLSELIKRVETTGNAKYVEFISLHDPSQMPGQRSSVLDWPYREGLQDGRGHASLDAVDLWSLRRSAPQPERCTHSHRGPLEIRFQERQVDCEDSLRGEAAGFHLDAVRST